ncbi:MAG: glycosyltransferase family 2 protein [Candidatus Melainabacteria bacterium]|nr:glycosyltransferase family 2 protein [Candidatus Melainabacteria bacterium]
MRNRIILLSITVGIWIFLKAIDNFVTGPECLFLLGMALVGMTVHSTWLYLAQSRWHDKARIFLKKKIPVAMRVTGSQNLKKLGQYKRVLGIRKKAPVENLTFSDWHPTVDIFVSAKNESRSIENTVRNLFKIDYDKYLLWIIDDCSTDSMPQILENLKSEFPDLRVINRAPSSYPGKSAALNEALAKSEGEVIVVFDADASVKPDFLNAALPFLMGERVGAVQVQKRIYESQKGLLVDCQASEYALDSYFQVGRDIIGGAVELRGNGQLIKREALIDVGGWNNKTLTDDLDLSMRLLVSNWDVKFCPNVWVFEEGVTTLKALLRQRRRWAEGSIRRYLDYIFPLNSPSRLSIMERIDTLVFTVYFVVPALVVLDSIYEIIHLATGVPTYGRFLALLSFLVLWVTQIDIFIALRMYRKTPVLTALWKSWVVDIYIYGHWVPVILLSFCQILFAKNHSTWHRTEHAGSHCDTTT